MKIARYVLKICIIGAALVCATAAVASSGTVTQLSGTLSVKKADGSVRICEIFVNRVADDLIVTFNGSLFDVPFLKDRESRVNRAVFNSDNAGVEHLL